MDSLAPSVSRDDFPTFFGISGLTYLVGEPYKAFIDGGAANELAAGAVMFLLLCVFGR